MDWMALFDEREGAERMNRDEGDPRSRLLARFHGAGYAPIDTPMLSLASVFLDFSGEDIRSGLFLTTDSGGNELCLRPEYTIPVCRAYLASESAGRQASFSYAGPVFRARSGGAEPTDRWGETVQAGLESFGRPDIAAADAEILVLALQAAHDAGFTDRTIRMGDAGLLGALLEALQIPSNWQRRLKRGLDKGVDLDAILTEAPHVSADHSGVLAALTGTDRQGARALVEDLLAIAGIASVGGRSAAEIADRFLAQGVSRAAPVLAGERKAVLERFLAIEGHPDDVSEHLRRLAADADLDLGSALDVFDERANFIAVHGLGSEDRLTYEAAFGRNLDYYTGFVFEARHAGREGPADVVIGGGRYDMLAQALGAQAPIAAVGAAIWVDRLSGPERPR